MGREKRISELRTVIKSNFDKAVEHAEVGTAAGLAAGAYVLTYANMQLNEVLEEKLDDLSERMKLIEAALGVIANGNKND